MDNKNQYIAMVNIRGRVIWCRSWEMDNLKSQGCRRIVNPREEYYPEYDLTLKTAVTPPDNLYQEDGVANMLEGIEV